MWLSEMSCFRNLPELKNLISKPDILEFFLFKSSLYRKTFASQSDSFFRKISLQTLIFNEKVFVKNMPFKMGTKSGKFVVFCGANWVKTTFFRCEFFIETWFLNKNWIQKLRFWKIFLPQKMIIRNVLYSKSAGTKNSQFKTWHFGIFSFQIFIEQENFCFRIWILFFWKFHFKLWFSMKKFATNSCLLKWARKVKNLLLSAEQIESKRYFLDVMFWSKSDSSIKIELKIYFSEKFCLHEMIFRKSILSKSTRTKNSRFKNWSICRKKLHFKIRIFFQKISFQNLIFNEKVYFKIMPFKISTKSESYVVFPGTNWVRTFFSDVNFWSKSDFSIKIELKNWVSGK